MAKSPLAVNFFSQNKNDPAGEIKDANTVLPLQTVFFEFTNPPREATEVVVEVKEDLQLLNEQAGKVRVMAKVEGEVRDGRFEASAIESTFRPPLPRLHDLRFVNIADKNNPKKFRVPIFLPDSIRVKKHTLSVEVRGRVQGRLETFQGDHRIEIRYNQNEITVVATFPKLGERLPWPNDKEEIQAMSSGQWSPTTQDFKAVAAADNKKSANRFQAANLDEFLGAIINRKNKLDRVVLISHADSQPPSPSIAFQGKVTATGAVSWNTFDSSEPRKSNGLDSNSVGKSGFLNDDPEGKLLRNTARDKFRSTGEIVLFVCGSGAVVLASWRILAEEIAKTFNVTVNFFANPIVYCPDFNPQGTIVTKRDLTVEQDFSLGKDPINSCPKKKRGYRHTFSGAITQHKPKTPFP
ncbi:MAG: hypothetical protein L0196_03315 [candidate division Zixibacteria bacterium]|nr:hypothetical protein [candidate division Zixibacteria bacterium]